MHGDAAPLDTDFEVLASSPRRFSRRAQAVLLAVVVLVAAVAGVRWLTDSNPPVRITAYGEPVADPQSVLDVAQNRFETYTAARHGALGPHAGCWFQRQSGSADIAGTLLCGPVLFYDDDPSAPYVQFPLIAHGTGSPVRLEAESRPTSSEPSAAPSGTTLVRPGRTSQPVHSAGISAPVPPPAPGDTLGVTDTVHPDDLVRASESSVIGADLITLTLHSFGKVDDFGSGSAERSAPDGLVLYAFRIVFSGGENGFALLPSLDLGVSVNGAAPRRVQLAGTKATGSGQLFVVAASPSASLDLVLTEYGISQRMSLRDGTPDPDNIQFLQSPHGIDPVPFAVTVPAVVTVAGHRMPTQLLVNLDSVERRFFIPGSAVHPRRHDHVFLFLSIEYRMTELPGTFGFATPGIMTLTPNGGTPIRGRIVDGTATPLYDVPVDMTDATITLAGSDPHLGYGLSLPGPVSFPLHMVPTDD